MVQFKKHSPWIKKTRTSGKYHWCKNSKQIAYFTLKYSNTCSRKDIILRHLNRSVLDIETNSLRHNASLSAFSAKTATRSFPRILQAVERHRHDTLWLLLLQADGTASTDEFLPLEPLPTHMKHALHQCSLSWILKITQNRIVSNSVWPSCTCCFPEQLYSLANLLQNS